MDAVILAIAFMSFLSLVAAWLVLPHSSAVMQPSLAARCECPQCLTDRTLAGALHLPVATERTARVLEVEPA